MKKYNILNNSLGWFCFVVAAVTYLLTLEPTASFWDCPEFITQGYKLEIGHPPGNPIFMLTARFFANFAFGDVTKVALCVNTMSGLLSAATILLLFWTITHLVKRLVVKDDATEVSPLKMLVIFGSGICGALMYTWSDTFWFSAVEGEVYAFSSFCTALVFWLILKWENRADKPHSDKYLILIAYVIGISIAVHLLNLLCIPAIVLVVYYRKWKNANVKGSLAALAVSFVIVALILYGLVPGFIDVSKGFEVFCVNQLGMPFNTGVLIYAIAVVAAFIWTIRCIYKGTNVPAIKISFLVSTFLSGILFIGSWWIAVILTAALVVWLIKCKRLPLRILNLISMSIFVIFIGYSSYALLLIRSSAHTPMNQNAPDNVFDLASYLNREQYGDRPLLYGATPYSRAMYRLLPSTDESDFNYEIVYTDDPHKYVKQVKTDPTQPDTYIVVSDKQKKNNAIETTPELNMLFTRMHSGDVERYSSWIGKTPDTFGSLVEATAYYDISGNPVKILMRKPSQVENISFLLSYQLNHMYWRYFMWNFAGRQNDIQGDGEPTHGNWISGIPFIDNPRLGDQSLLPDEFGKDNPGHNVFYMLPLLLGLIGLIWQASTSHRGTEQFWVVFFLFFMTGIAIVLYLNQTPGQPRERDYAFAGSFYAYAIWVGMGVAGLWRLLVGIFVKKAGTTKAAKRESEENQAYYDPEQGGKSWKTSLVCASIAALVGILVPLQVVSQTWDDHDRSDRYTARDFGMNYLNSLEPNAIIFTYGDNDTFPLWYAQEVEGVRTDVKVVNLSYLQTDWYADQLRRPSYDAKGIELQATPDVYSHDKLVYRGIGNSVLPYKASEVLAEIYQATKEGHNEVGIPGHHLYIPVDTEAIVKNGRIKAEDQIFAGDIHINYPQEVSSLYLNGILSLDMLSTSVANGWNRPIYYAITTPNEYHNPVSNYLSQIGMAYEVTPFAGQWRTMDLDKTYDIVTSDKWRWGGIDKVTKPGQIYLDETVRRMLLSNRGVLMLLAEGYADKALEEQTYINDDSDPYMIIDSTLVDTYIKKAETVVGLIETKLPEVAQNYDFRESLRMLDLYMSMYQLTGNKEYYDKGYSLLRRTINRYKQYSRYYQSMSPRIKKLLNNRDYEYQYYLDIVVYLAAPKYGIDTQELIAALDKEGIDVLSIDEFSEFWEQWNR